MPFPNFLIIGETKCGTTSMYDTLIKHPQIMPSKGNGSEELVDADVPLGVKEIRFFDKYFYKGWDWYKNCFPECPDGVITGEATPMYLYKTQALTHIASTMSDCKIIVMLRNPTDRLYSHFNHISINESDWLEKYPSILDLLVRAHPKDYHLIDRGFYIKQLFGLFALFDQENVKVVILEDLLKDQLFGMNSILAFLGVDANISLEMSHSRKRKNNLIEERYRSEIDEMYRPFNEMLEETLCRQLWR